MPGFLDRLQGRLRRPPSGIGATNFNIELQLNELESGLSRTIDESLLRGLAGLSAPILFRGVGGGGGGGGTSRGGGGAAGGGGATRFSAATRSGSFSGGAGAGFGTASLLGGRVGIGGAGLAAAGGLFAADSIRDLAQNLIEASAAFETFERTVRATEATSEDAAVRWQALLDIAEETVGIDIAGLVQYNSQLRVIGVEAERVDAILRGTVKSVSELGRGVHVSREALNQLTDGIVRNHLNVRDWRAIVARIPQFLEAASRALGQTVLSLDDFKDAANANEIAISEGIIRSLEELNETAVGLQGTYVAAVDRFDEASFKLRATLGEDLKDTATPVIGALAEGLNALNEALNQTPEEKLQSLFDRLNEVRGSRTILGDNPLQREALADIRRFLAENPGALPDTSPGAFRAIERDSRTPAAGEQPTARSLDFFASVGENRQLQEEFLRGDLQSAGGDFVAQIAATETQITDTVGRLRAAVNVDTEEQTVSQQRIVQGLQSELDVLFKKLPVLKELQREQEGADRAFQKNAENSAKAIADQTKTVANLAEAFAKADTAAAKFGETLQALADSVVEGDIARRTDFADDIAISGIGALATEQREQGFQIDALTNRFFDVGTEFLSASPGERAARIAGRPIPSTRLPDDRITIPSQQDLDERSAARFDAGGRFEEVRPDVFREADRAAEVPRDLQALVDEALQGGVEGFDPERYRELYDERIDGERRALRAAERSARQYQRIWDRTFQSVADTAIEAIFNRNLDFGEALSGIAQQSLSDIAGFYIRQLVGESGGSLFGSGTAAGAGVALGGANLLFPQEFSNLFEEIGNTLGGVRNLFHDPVSDLYAQRQGSEVARSFEGNDPDAQRNSRDFADNFSAGFQREASPQGMPTGDLNITINLGESEDAMIQLGVSLRELIEKGLLVLP